MISPRKAQRTMGVGRAQAVEPIDLVFACSSTHTWVGETLIDLLIAFISYKKFEGN